MQNGLTKENFWDKLHSQYPLATQLFYDWVDEYKKKVKWTDLFRDHLNGDAKFSSPKFHDLPYAMQLGIWIQFVNEQGGCSWEVDLFTFDLREEITEYISNVLEE